MGLPAEVSWVLKQFKEYNGVRDTLTEQIAEYSGETTENCVIDMLTESSMRNQLEIIAFKAMQSGSCDSGATL